VAIAERLGALVDLDTIERRAADLLAVDDWDGPPLWLHGDLHSARFSRMGTRLLDRVAPR
jgi:hypothetical protein